MHNLAIPENADKAKDAQAQKVAGLLLHKLRKRDLTRGQVRVEIDSILDVEHRERVRGWINKFAGVTDGNTNRKRAQ